MTDVFVDLIDPNPDQPRKHFDEGALAELAQSMDEKGLVVPIMVRPLDGRYVIVHGERRWRAAQLLGWDTLRAEVRDLAPAEAYKLALIENVQRASLSPIEEAAAFRHLIDGDGMTQAELGEMIGKSQQFVADRLALIRLPDEIQEMVTARSVSPSIARRLVAIDDAKTQKRIARMAANEKLTVKEIEGEKRRWEFEQERAARRAMDFDALVAEAPALARYSEAVNRGNLSVDPYSKTLEVPTLEKEFDGQSWHWPKYSGVKRLAASHDGHGEWTLKRWDEWGEDLSVPLFTEQEWLEFHAFDERAAVAALDFQDRPYFSFHFLGKTNERGECPLCRREYDPDYGRLFFGPEDTCHHDHFYCLPLFVKRGWGEWRIIEFNDGDGGRMERRYFVHDFMGDTLIKQAMDTVDPFVFSHHNLDRMKLWQVQKYQASWFYWRRKTLPRDEVIAALEADLEMLRNAKPLSDEEFTEQVLDWLQSYIPADLDAHAFREGYCSYPRRRDGTVEADFFRASR